MNALYEFVKCSTILQFYNFLKFDKDNSMSLKSGFIFRFSFALFHVFHLKPAQNIFCHNIYTFIMH